MFGKEQGDVVTDKEVGDYIKKLHEKEPLADVMNEVCDGLEDNSTNDTSGPEKKD